VKPSQACVQPSFFISCFVLLLFLWLHNLVEASDSISNLHITFDILVGHIIISNNFTTNFIPAIHLSENLAIQFQISVGRPNLVEIRRYVTSPPKGIMTACTKGCHSSTHRSTERLRSADSTELARAEPQEHICLVVAQGLYYLHASSQSRILHRGSNASNRLLDKNLHTKIADFVNWH